MDVLWDTGLTDTMVVAKFTEFSTPAVEVPGSALSLEWVVCGDDLFILSAALFLTILYLRNHSVN